MYTIWEEKDIVVGRLLCTEAAPKYIYAIGYIPQDSATAQEINHYCLIHISDCMVSSIHKTKQDLARFLGERRLIPVNGELCYERKD